MTTGPLSSGGGEGGRIEEYDWDGNLLWGVDEFVPPMDAAGNYLLTAGSAYGPTSLHWIYHAPNPTDLYSEAISGAQRLANGNTLICDGVHGVLLEVTEAGELVWKYVNPEINTGILYQGDVAPLDIRGHDYNAVFKVERYATDFSAFTGRDLTPSGPVELYRDWIELRNPGTAAVDLGGMYLTNDPSTPKKFLIPSGVSIPAGGYLLFYADNQTTSGSRHLNFTLDAAGGTISLYDIDGITRIDTVTYGAQTTDVSSGRYPDGTGNWQAMTTATPGVANAVTVNQTPTDETLSATAVAENLPAGTPVGTLTTTDPNTGDTFTYSLVSGIGSTDNASFTLSGSTLQTAASFDYETKNSYSIRIRSTDQGGLYFEKVFSISVTPPNQSPVISGTSRNPTAPSATVPVWVTSTVTDDGSVSGVTLTYSTGSGTPTATTVFTETMTTTEVKPWTGSGAVNAWTVTGTLLEQRIGSNYGTGNACGLEYKGGAALNALTAAMLTTTNAINAAGTAGYVEFWVQTLTLTGTDGWTFQLDSGSGYVTRLSELTGSSHGWQQYRYDLASTELVSTLKMWFQFTGGGTTGGVADDDRIDLDQITVSVTSGGATTNTVTMIDDGAHGDGAAGDHVYGGQIPALANGTTVSYYVTATDNSGLVTTDPATAPANKYSYTVGAAALTVNVVATSVAENAGAAATTVTISRNTDTTAALAVSLASSDSSEATVPATATIPAGQSSVTVNLAAVDDTIVDGTQTVTITASATGFASGSDTLQVTDDDVANHTPTDVLLASDSVPENQPAGTSVGTFSTVDPDAWDTFTYALVPGPGDADNGAFRISGNQLVTAVLLDYELKSTTSIRVRTTDQGGLSFERPLTVQILDVNEAPRVVAPIPNQTAPANRQFRFALAPDTFVDPDAGQRLSYAATQADGSPLPKWLKFDSSTRTFSGRPLVRDVGQISVRVMATDSSSPPLAAWAEFSITVTSHLFPWQNAEQPEDVDGNGLVTPQDVLIVINWINGHGGGPVPTPFPDPVDSPLFFDVYGDNLISSMDVLVVINYLNGRSSFTPQAAEGEGMPAATVRRVTPVRQTEIIGPLRLQDTAVDQTFGREADLSSPADWDELLGVLAQGSTTRTWGAIPSYQIR